MAEHFAARGRPVVVAPLGGGRVAGAGLRIWAMPAVMSVFVAVGIGMGTMGPLPGQPVAALFPPWWSASEAFAAAASAHATIIRRGAWPTLVIAAAAGPDLSKRLRGAGAWLILDARALGACSAAGLAAR